LTQEELNKPVPPPEPGQAAAQFGPTAAQNLLTALSDLRNTQNNFMSVWLNYYATRMQLLRELGIMTLDDEGRWIDLPIPELTAEQLEQLEQLETPPALPREWIDQAFQDEAGPPNPALEAPSPDSPPTPPTGVPATLPPPQTVPRSLPTIPAGPDGAAQPAPAIVPAGHAEAVSAEVGSTAFPAVPDGSEEPSRSACSSAGFVRMRR
jgi:hypothetical protein